MLFRSTQVAYETAITEKPRAGPPRRARRVLARPRGRKLLRRSSLSTSSSAPVRRSTPSVRLRRPRPYGSPHPPTPPAHSDEPLRRPRRLLRALRRPGALCRRLGGLPRKLGRTPRSQRRPRPAQGASGVVVELDRWSGAEISTARRRPAPRWGPFCLPARLRVSVPCCFDRDRRAVRASREGSGAGVQGLVC